jgi:HD-GYP domain-containing protein (c-di-GMP phosphodiesterase class II)
MTAASGDGDRVGRRAATVALHDESELVHVLEHEPRFSAYKISARDMGWVELAMPDGAAVLVFPELWTDPRRLEPHLLRSRSGYLSLVLLGSDEEFERIDLARLRDDGDILAITLPVGPARLEVLLRNLREHLHLRKDAAEGELTKERYRYELDELNAIGRALSSERDLDKLLALILEKCRQVTSADAGSVYVVEGSDDQIHKRTLRFKISQNDSVRLDFTEFTLPVSEKSIVGRCVLSREVINIPDLYKLDEPGTGNNPWGFKHNREFDARNRYQTRSMLTVPMIDAGDQVIGVIQLINKKRRPETLLSAAADFERQVMAFDVRSAELASNLASQAGISLENALLYDDIRQLFEGFVRASVTAIEQRDPTTSGHSQRVADLTVGLAKVTARTDTGPFSDFTLSYDEIKQIEYAALLHDFGKVGVRENVLVKAKKLYEADRELILARFDFIRKAVEADLSQKKLHVLLEYSRDEAMAKLDFVDAELAARIKELDDYVAFVLKANEPSVLEQGGFERLADIAKRSYRDPRGQEQPFLRPLEVETLQILRGSLTVKERIEIESHVSHTYNFLRTIPWGRHFKDIPEIAGAHHEKLDGSGYPRRLVGDAIPVPARMMTIADIYDALTASDRPYKRAVPQDKALDIIGSEVKQGKLDADLYGIFVDAKVYLLAHTPPR